jgi:hypothetical protein
MTRLRRSIVALALLASVSGCPQERPEAARQIPRERIPPAVSLEPPAGGASGHAPPASAGTRPVDSGAPARTQP